MQKVLQIGIRRRGGVATPGGDYRSQPITYLWQQGVFVLRPQRRIGYSPVSGQQQWPQKMPQLLQSGAGSNAWHGLRIGHADGIQQFTHQAFGQRRIAADTSPQVLLDTIEQETCIERHNRRGWQQLQHGTNQPPEQRLGRIGQLQFRDQRH